MHALHGIILVALPPPAQQHRLDELQEAQQEKITSLSAELQSTNEALNDLSLAKETAVKEKVIIIVHHSYTVSSTVMLSATHLMLY